MFRRHPQSIGELLPQYLRNEGLETPLLERRILSAWDTVAGRIVARYTTEKSIYNRVLMVKISNPALRQDLSMMRRELVSKLNAAVGSIVITDLKIH